MIVARCVDPNSRINVQVLSADVKAIVCVNIPTEGHLLSTKLLNLVEELRTPHNIHCAVELCVTVHCQN